MRRLAKLGLFSVPAAGLAYFAHQSYFGNSQKVYTYNEPILSETLNQYVKENNLVTPLLYKNYQLRYNFDQFFEKSLLKTLAGLQSYNIFISEDYNDTLMNQPNLGPEEKHKLYDNAKLHCTFSATPALQSQQGVVHNGLISTLLDTTGGYLAFMACDFTPAVTAYANLSFQNPLEVGKDYVAVIEVDKVEGRKVFLKGQIIDKEKNVYTTLDTMFIKVKWDNFYIKNLYKSLLIDQSGVKSTSTGKEGINVKPSIKDMSPQ